MDFSAFVEGPDRLVDVLVVDAVLVLRDLFGKRFCVGVDVVASLWGPNVDVYGHGAFY